MRVCQFRHSGLHTTYDAKMGSKLQEEDWKCEMRKGKVERGSTFLGLFLKRRFRGLSQRVKRGVIIVAICRYGGILLFEFSSLRIDTATICAICVSFLVRKKTAAELSATRRHESDKISRVG